MLQTLHALALLVPCTTLPTATQLNRTTSGSHTTAPRRLLPPLLVSPLRGAHVHYCLEALLAAVCKHGAHQDDTSLHMHRPETPAIAAEGGHARQQGQDASKAPAGPMGSKQGADQHARAPL